MQAIQKESVKSTKYEWHKIRKVWNAKVQNLECSTFGTSHCKWDWRFKNTKDENNWKYKQCQWKIIQGTQTIIQTMKILTNN